MRLFLIFALLLALSACAKAPDKRFFVCEALLPAFLNQGERAEVTNRQVAPDDPHRVIVEYMQHGPFLDRRSTLSCTFTADEAGGRLGLIAVEEARTGPLSPITLDLYRLELGHELGLDLNPTPVLSEEHVGPPSGPVALPYLLQQIVNALILGAIYGLTAVGYTLVYGVIGVINFAYGDIYMDPEVAQFVKQTELDALFDLGYHTKHVDTIFARVFDQS